LELIVAADVSGVVVARQPGVAAMPLSKKLGAEFIGTFWLVLGGCGSAVLAAKFPEIGIGLVGVALAFGLTVVTMAYAVGHISGGHFNPAITIGLFAGGRTPAGELLPYILAQLAGAIVAVLVLYVIASGKAGFDLAAGFASNGYGEHSPGGYSLAAGFVTELVLTAGFLFVIMGVTDRRAPSGFAPLAIGLTLTLIHLISIPVTNTSVNPARSTGPALLVGGWALAQLWLFWLAPILGGIVGGVAYRWLAAPAPIVAAEVPAAAD
jgi:aquaporin Z